MEIVNSCSLLSHWVCIAIYIYIYIYIYICVCVCVYINIYTVYNKTFEGENFGGFH